MRTVTVKMRLEDVVVVDEEHGGYTGGHCTACGASGWIDGRYGLRHDQPKGAHLVHKRSCPMNEAIR